MVERRAQERRLGIGACSGCVLTTSLVVVVGAVVVSCKEGVVTGLKESVESVGDGL